MSLIDARGLSIGHGGRVILSGLDLRLRPGQVLAVLGPNGVGKTTLFRTLLGLIPPLSGQILLQGQPLAALSPAARAARLAHVPQALAPAFAFTALDIVLMGAAVGLGRFARPGPAQYAAARAALDSMGIADLAACPVTDLSGGQRQLVLIARALAQGARAMILDEPTASLDFANRLRVQGAIADLAARGIGVILSSHDPDQAAALADQALLIGRGGVIASGPPGRVMRAETLSRLYGVPVRRHALPEGGQHFAGG